MQYKAAFVWGNCSLRSKFEGLQEDQALERARLDAAAAREEQEETEVLRTKALKQQQEQLFIRKYLEQQECAKLDEVLNLAAEEARQDERELPPQSHFLLRAACHVVPTIEMPCCEAGMT